MSNFPAEVPRAVDGERKRPGTWQRALNYTPEPDYQPYWTAIVWCPECGRGLLASRHTIDANGQISPSLGHPDSYPPCGWHLHPRLLGWTPSEWQLPPRPDLNTCENCGVQARSVGGWGTWSGGSGIICGKCFKERAALFKDRAAMKESPHG